MAAVVCSAYAGLACATAPSAAEVSNILSTRMGCPPHRHGLSGNLFVGGERRSRLGTVTPEWMAPGVGAGEPLQQLRRRVVARHHHYRALHG